MDEGQDEEQTLVLIKPDGLKKSLTGNILSVLSETRLKIVGAKVMKVPRELAEKHYEHLKGKPFYEGVIDYITGKIHGENRVMVLVYQGKDAIKKIREICGATNPEEAEPTTIRGKYGRILQNGVYENVIHSSGSREEAEREIKLWMKPEELVYRIYPTKKVKREVEVLEWA